MRRGPGKPFKKGNKLAKGRPPLTEEEKVIRKLTKAEFVELASIILKGDKSALEKMAKDPGTPIIKAMAGSVAAQIIKKGDMDALDKFLNRIIGKVKEEVEVSGNSVQVIVGLPPNGSEKKKDG